MADTDSAKNQTDPAKLPVSDALKQQGIGPKCGLPATEAKKRFDHYGPIPWLIEAAALGLWEGHEASNTLAALKGVLARKASFSNLI
jgi:hypothetical protein